MGSRALGSIGVLLPGAQVSLRRPGSLGNGSMRNRQCPKRADHEKGDLGGGYSLEQEAQAPQHHPHCYHWRSQGYGEDRGTSEGQLHRVLWGWSCAQAATGERWVVRCLHPAPRTTALLRPSSTLTCNSSRWICSESSCISESRDRAGLGVGGVKTSSFRGALQDGKGVQSFP